MSFLQPQIVETAYWAIETPMGTEFIPADVADFDGDPWDESAEAARPEFVDVFRDYLESDDIQSAERVDGFLWRLSAPGYFDCTDWSPAASVTEAIRDMLGMYGDGFDLEDYQSVAPNLDGWDAFWQGYLLGLAFTGRQEGPPDAPYEEPIFSNPGSDIAEVVDTDELESNLSDEDRLELYGDALAFFLDALPMLGTEYERAGSDFHLTRNGHGAGFWDGDWPEHGDKLTELSKPYSLCELTLGPNGYYLTH